MFVKKLFRFIFIERTIESEATLPIEALEVSRRKSTKKQGKSGKSKTAKSAKQNLVADKIIINANRLLGLILIGSFLAIIIFSLFGKSDELPSEISYTFSTTLGYFGGIIVNYMDKYSRL